MKRSLDKCFVGVTKHNKIIGIMILILAISCIVGIFFVHVNSDLFSYLPKESESYQGNQVITEYFGIGSNILIAIQGETIDENGNKHGATQEEIADMADKIRGVDSVSSVMWLGDIKKLSETIPIAGDDVYNKAQEILQKDDMYLVMVNMNVSAASDEAAAAYNEIKDITDNYEVAYGGTTPLTQNIYDATLKELPWYITAAFVLVLIILILTARNYVEPIVFMTTLGVSILINMGTNFIFGEISIITYCASAVLQLGLAMDYAIFLTHMYYDERAKGMNVKDAITCALPKTFATITASALTTIAGMATLYAMRFTIGADIARVIIKGIVLAWLSVLLLQPCLLVWASKAMEKTQKKPLDFHFEPLAKTTVKYRVVIVVIAALLIVPAFVGQMYLKLNYVSPLLTYDTNSELEAYANSMNTAIFVAVPVEEDENGIKQQYEFIDNLNALEEEGTVSSVTGVFPMIDKSLCTRYLPLVKTVLANSEESKMLYNNGYTLYIISLNPDLPIESDETDVALNKVRNAVSATFDGQETYITGTVQGVSDFKATTPQDFKVISILSIVAVLLILILTFKSIKYPIMLVLLIQFGIWINYSINTIFGMEMNFVSYLAISAVQLGATVDYAILLTKKYKTARAEGKDPLEASFLSSKNSSMSVLTSASIMMVACLSVTFIASNKIVKEVTMLVARGAIISCLLVLVVLPSLLSCSERFEKFFQAETANILLTDRKKAKLEKKLKAKKSSEENCNDNVTSDYKSAFDSNESTSVESYNEIIKNDNDISNDNFQKADKAEENVLTDATTSDKKSNSSILEFTKEDDVILDNVKTQTTDVNEK